MKNILVVGSINMDLVVKAERMPRGGETLVGSGFTQAPGGKGANQAAACARLGARTFMIGRVGGDAFGKALVGCLKRSGVKTDFIVTDKSEPTGIAIIIVDRTGQNSIVVASGANAKVCRRDLSAAGDVWDKADFLIVQLEIPIETMDAALTRARRKGIVSIMDAGPAKKIPLSTLRKADIVSPNETETEALIGKRVTSLRAARAAAERLRKLGVKRVVLKLGERGALAAEGSRYVHVPARKVKAVDTTAAGDAFTAALAVALGEGKDLVAATEFACCAGALACTKLGAQPSMPTREEVEKFAARR